MLGVGKTGLRRFVGARTLVLLWALAAIGGGAWYYLRPQDSPRQPFTYVTQPVAKADMVVRVTATGTVQPTNKVDVPANVRRRAHSQCGLQFEGEEGRSAGRARHCKARRDGGEYARKAECRPRRLARCAGRARGQALRLRAQEGAVASGRGDAQDLDTAKAAYDHALVALDTAKANIEVAEAQLRLDETNLQRARIVSPIDGVVLMRKVDPGQTVASPLQAPVLFTIAEDLARMEIQVDVDEADVGKVRKLRAPCSASTPIRTASSTRRFAWCVSALKWCRAW